MSVALQRLEELSRGGDPALRVLYAAALPPEEGVAVLPAVLDPLVRLQRAFCTQELGRTEEARELLDSLGGLSQGLERRRQQLRSESAEPEQEAPRETGGDRTEPFASHTLAALHASQGDTNTAARMYQELLARDPGDEESRRRLEVLQGTDRSGRAVNLEEWLTAVRAWREHLRV